MVLSIERGRWWGEEGGRARSANTQIRWMYVSLFKRKGGGGWGVDGGESFFGLWNFSEECQSRWL